MVTGGAGYIGSHMVLALLDAGHSPLILDDFSTGHEQLVPVGVPVIRGNVGDREVTDRLFADHKIDAVAHFAASIVVPESVADPLKYYLNNTVSTARLIKACARAGAQEKQAIAELDAQLRAQQAAAKQTRCSKPHCRPHQQQRSPTRSGSGWPRCMPPSHCRSRRPATPCRSSAPPSAPAPRSTASSAQTARTTVHAPNCVCV
mgnify:CR=1 FL=1